MSETIQGFLLSPQQRRAVLRARDPQRRDPLFAFGCAVRLRGTLDRSRLEGALRQLIEHHEILRTRFHTVDGVRLPLQTVSAEVAIEVEEVSLPSPAGGETTQIAELVDQARARVGALENGTSPSTLCTRLVSVGVQEHWLVLGLSDLCGDAPSLRLAVAQLARAYAGDPMTDEVLQYADFAEWQNQLLTAEEEVEGLARWRAFDLAEGLAEHPPLARGTSDPKTELGAKKHLLGLDQGFWKRLEDNAAVLEADPGDLLLAAWTALLARLGDRRTVHLAWHCDGREIEELVASLGPIAKFVPLRIHFEPGASFATAVGEATAARETALEFQEYFSFELYESPEVAAGQRLSVAFEVCDGMPEVDAGGLAWSGLVQQGYSDRFELLLRVVTGSDLELHYDTHCFEADEVVRLGEALVGLIEQGSGTPDRPLATLEVVGSGEAGRLVGFETGESLAVRQTLVHQQFFDGATRHPERLALVVGDERLSYGELAASSARLAHHLRQQGVRAETPVVLCMERSADLIVGMLAVLAAGGAFVALDPDLPAKRLAALLADLAEPLVLAQTSMLERLRAAGVAEPLCLDRDTTLWADQPEAPPSHRLDPENLAYLLFTSGSTGRPKAVAVSHGNLANYCAAVDHCLAFPRAEGDWVPSFGTVTTLAADLGNTVIFPALALGGILHVLSYEVAMSGELLERYQEEMPIDVLKIVPSHFAALTAEDEGAGAVPHELLIFGGEALDAELVERARSRRPSCRVVNHYGPTEATVGALTWRIPEVLEGLPMALGGPLPNTSAHVVGPGLRRFPRGVAGELCLAGAGLARGYHSRPAQTAERFVPNPFAESPGERLYRTGDRALRASGGEIEFLGRVDHQVKVRGFRIELGEIESTLAALAGVRSAVVMVTEDRLGRPRLTAWVVLRQKGVLDRESLTDHLRETLPEAMVPSALVFLDALPLTANGKVDRGALPDPDEAGLGDRLGYVAPRNPTEQQLAEIWASVLGLERVGVEDNFLRLGGDSILSIRVVARARQVGMAVTPRQVFDHPTIAELAQVSGQLEVIEAEQGLVVGEVGLTPIQSWFFEQELVESHHFNQAVLLRLREPCPPSLLEQAVAALLRHHDALRLRFESSNIGWQGLLDDELPTGICRHHDLSGLAAEERDQALTVAAGELQTRFDLTTGPIFAAATFAFEPDRASRLLLAAHHLAVDGVSWRVLLEDLQTLLGQLQQGGKLELSPKTTSFQRWSQRLSDYAAGETLTAELEYWSRQLSAEPVPLPLDHDSGPAIGSVVETVRFELTEDETHALLREVPDVFESEINEALLSALLVAFCRWTGRSSFLFELEGHGRQPVVDDVDLTRTVGWFTTRFPVRLALPSSTGPAAVLEAVSRSLRAVPERGIGYGLLRYNHPDATVRERLRALPESQVTFNYLGQFDEVLGETGPFALADEDIGPTRSPRAARRHLLNVDGGVTDGALRMTFTFSTRHHRRGTIETLVDGFGEALRALLTAAAKGPELSVPSSDVELDQDTLSKILRQVGQTKKGASA